MTEELKPKGTPYGLAMSILQEHAVALPSAIVVAGDRVLWQSQFTHPAQTLQLLEEAAAVLSALSALHIPLSLLVPAHSAQRIKSCLAEAQTLPQFAAVVEYSQQPAENAAQAPSPPQEQQRGQQHHRVQQPPSNSSWMDAATAVKAATGVPWQQMLLFCPADALDAVRLANRLGMACVRVPAEGLNVDALRSGLDAYSSKLESDRGY